jgi:aryl carrier-like protein
VVRGAYEPPQGETERAIAAIVEDLLGIERAGRNDNFFDLGGTSLMVVGFMQRLAREGFHVDLQTIVSATTIVELASVISSATRETD